MERAPQPCPRCGYRLDADAPPANARYEKPSPGDLSMCLRCSAVLTFAPDLHLRLLTAHEWDNSLTPEERAQFEHLRAQNRARIRTSPDHPANRLGRFRAW